MRTICACRGLGSSLQRKREYLQKQLEDVGFRVLPAQGTYFLVADIRYSLMHDDSTHSNILRRVHRVSPAQPLHSIDLVLDLMKLLHWRSVHHTQAAVEGGRG